MKKVKITISDSRIKITSFDLFQIVQIMSFMGHTQFNRIKEEYVNFCLNGSLTFTFHVGNFYIHFESVENLTL